MVKGIGQSTPFFEPKRAQKQEGTKEPIVSQELKENTKNLVKTQHKSLRKQIARMLSDGQKGLNNLGVHEEKAFRLIAHHKGQLQHALQSFDEKHVMPFIEKEVFKQEEMFASAKQTLESGGKTHEGLGAQPPHQGLGARPSEHKPHTQAQHHSPPKPHLGSKTPFPSPKNPFPPNSTLGKEFAKVFRLLHEMMEEHGGESKSLSQQVNEAFSTLFKDVRKFSDNSDRSYLQISLSFANQFADDANSIHNQTISSFFQNLVKQGQSVLNSSPTAGLQDFLNKYGYNGYHNGTKNPLLLCPQMWGQEDPQYWDFHFSFLATRFVFIDLSATKYSPPSQQTLNLVKEIENLQKMSNNPLAAWLIKEIQSNPNISGNMTGAQIFTYLMDNYNLLQQIPGLTDADLSAVCKDLGVQNQTTMTLLAYYLGKMNVPKGTPEYQFIQLLISECSKQPNIADLQQWVVTNFLQANTDIYMQIPNITQQDIKNVFNAIFMPDQKIPPPTKMDQLFTQVYDAFQKTPSAPILKDLYEELQKLGSSEENMGPLQKWAAGMLNSADFKNSPPQAQAQFCVWTGNVTLGAIDAILQGWENSSNTAQASLAKFILGQKFSSLDQMRSFFNPNSPNYGFGKLDIYFQCPGLLNSSDPSAIVKNFFTMLFAGTSTQPNVSQPTTVDKAYAGALAALNGASPADQALFNMIINQCKKMGSDWSEFQYWAGFEMLSSTFQNASSAAKSLFAKICGFKNPGTAPLTAMSYFLSQILQNFDASSPTYQFLTKITGELKSLETSNGNLGSFQFWISKNAFSNVNIYMLCPDASTSEMNKIFQYIMGPNAKLPPETQADKNYIALYHAMNAPGVFSGNKALYEDLLNAMLSAGSNPPDPAAAIQNYFNAHPSAMTQLKKDWANADTAGQKLFEQYTNGWTP